MIPDKVEFPFWIGEPPYRQLIHDAKQLAQYSAEHGVVETSEAFVNRKMTFDRADLKGLTQHEQWQRIFQDACRLPLTAVYEWRRLMHLVHMNPGSVHEVREVLSKGDWRCADLTNGLPDEAGQQKTRLEPRAEGSINRRCSVNGSRNNVLRRMTNVVNVAELPWVDSQGVRLPELFGRPVPFSLLMLRERINFHGITEEKWVINTPRLWSSLDSMMQSSAFSSSGFKTGLAMRSWRTRLSRRRRMAQKLQAVWRVNGPQGV